jgi:hypothetical protein
MHTRMQYERGNTNINYLSPPLHPARLRAVTLKKWAGPYVSEEMRLQLQYMIGENAFCDAITSTITVRLPCNLRYTVGVSLSDDLPTLTEP